MIRGLLKFGLLLMLAGAFAHSACADTIQLHSSARATAPIALRDVATLEGPDALALGDLIVFELPTQTHVARVDLSIEDIRNALNERKPDIRWGKIALSGDSCSLRLVTEQTKPPEPEPAAPPEPAPVPAKMVSGPTWQVVADLRDDSLRAAIGNRLANFLKAEPDAVRISFSESDSTLLNTPAAGRTLDIQPTGLGAMVPVVIRIFAGERVVAAGTARVRVEQRRSVVGAARALHRGDLVTDKVVFSESRWTTPGERLATQEAIIGKVVKNRVQPGELFLEGDVEAAILVKRGDIVNVACLAGSIVLNTKARAMANAGENDIIEFTPLRNSKSKVTARVVAPGQAVINAVESEDQVYQGAPIAPQEPQIPPDPARASAPVASEKASVGAVTVQRVTTKPDGTFVVEAATRDPKKPVRKMKFIPLDEP